MRQETKERIKREVITFGKKVITTEYSLEELKKAFPFHSVFFTDEGLRAFKEQRTLVTKMGLQLFPQIALIIALDKYSDAHRDYLIKAQADSGMISKADRIIDELRTRQRTPNYERELREIKSAMLGKKGTYQVMADLYIGDFKPGPFFMEIKSPRPNLDVCAESKKKMWYFRIINIDKSPEAYLGFPYNPFIHREDYAHSFTKQIMDMKNEVLIGEEMRDKIGGKGTYDELLEILEQAKIELRKEIQKTLSNFS